VQTRPRNEVVLRVAEPGEEAEALLAGLVSETHEDRWRFDEQEYRRGWDCQVQVLWKSSILESVMSERRSERCHRPEELCCSSSKMPRIDDEIGMPLGDIEFVCHVDLVEDR
jgi:hypothetical protein